MNTEYKDDAGLYEVKGLDDEVDDEKLFDKLNNTIIVAPKFSNSNNEIPLTEAEVQVYVHNPLYKINTKLFLKRSDFLYTMAESISENSNPKDFELLQLDVPPNILLDIFEFVKIPVEERITLNKPLVSSNLFENCNNILAVEYINSIHTDKHGKSANTRLFDLVFYANSLGITDLLELGSAKVASLIKGQPIEKLASILKK